MKVMLKGVPVSREALSTLHNCLVFLKPRVVGCLPELEHYKKVTFAKEVLKAFVLEVLDWTPEYAYTHLTKEHFASFGLMPILTLATKDELNEGRLNDSASLTDAIFQGYRFGKPHRAEIEYTLAEYKKAIHNQPHTLTAKNFAIDNHFSLARQQAVLNYLLNEVFHFTSIHMLYDRLAEPDFVEMLFSRYKFDLVFGTSTEPIVLVHSFLRRCDQRDDMYFRSDEASFWKAYSRYKILTT